MRLTTREFWRAVDTLRDQGEKYENCPSAVKDPSQRRSIRDGVFFHPYPIDTQRPCRELIFRTLERYLKGLHKEGIIKSRLGPHREHRVLFSDDADPIALLRVHLHQEKYPDVSICARFEKNPREGYGYQVSVGLMYTPILERMIRNMRGKESVSEPVDL